MTSSMKMSCLCGAVSQQVKARLPASGVTELALIHGDIDRHTSGVLCVSYYPIEATDISTQMSRHEGADGWTRHFCSTCGCHILRNRVEDAQSVWEVATGVVLESTNQDESTDARYVKHTLVSETKDGGVSIWLDDFDGSISIETPKEIPSLRPQTRSTPLLPVVETDSLLASCACGGVTFHITRPNDASYLPHSGYPDLQYAACSHSAEFMLNQKDEKWWIRASGKKYLAGTCACRSCRLGSGFEIQTWAFVPRSNIFFHVPSPNGQPTVMPLDFATLPRGILQTHESSAGVLREFCGTCGATVFWHDKWRPDVIDVSVGLLRAEEGARAGLWLDWWTQRCSFEEEAERGRKGGPARAARRLIDGLERGLRSGGTTC